MAAAPDTRVMHHLGYFVDDLEAAAQHFAVTLGAGPFLSLGHVPQHNSTFRGETVDYDHSTAFGQWGPILLEISQIHFAEPPSLREFFLGGGVTPRIGHVAWLADDLDAESDALANEGLPLVRTGGSGPVQTRWHDGRSLLGHSVELLRRSPEILAFYDSVRSASVGWDRRRPLRDATAPPA